MSIYTIHPDDVIESRMDDKGRVTVPKDVREEWNVSGGDRLEFAVINAEDSGYKCDECGSRNPLPKVLIKDSGEIVCGDCVTVEDRIITD